MSGLLPNLPYEIRSGLYCKSVLEFKSTAMFKLLEPAEHPGGSDSDLVSVNISALKGNLRDGLSDGVDCLTDLDLLNDLAGGPDAERSFQSGTQNNDKTLVKKHKSSVQDAYSRLQKKQNLKRMATCIEEVTAEGLTSSKSSNRVDISPNGKQIDPRDFFTLGRFQKTANQRAKLQAAIPEFEAEANLSCRSSFKVQLQPTSARFLQEKKPRAQDARPREACSSNKNLRREPAEGLNASSQSIGQTSRARPLDETDSGPDALASDRPLASAWNNEDRAIIRSIQEELNQESLKREREQFERSQQITREAIELHQIKIPEEAPRSLPESELGSSTRKRCESSSDCFQTKTPRDLLDNLNIRSSIKSVGQNDRLVPKPSHREALQPRSGAFPEKGKPGSGHQPAKSGFHQAAPDRLAQEEQADLPASAERVARPVLVTKLNIKAEPPRDYLICQESPSKPGQAKILLNSERFGQFTLMQGSADISPLNWVVWDKLTRFFARLENKLPDLVFPKGSPVDFDQAADRVLLSVSQMQKSLEGLAEQVRKAESDREGFQKKIELLEGIVKNVLDKAERAERLQRSQSPQTPADDFLPRAHHTVHAISQNFPHKTASLLNKLSPRGSHEFNFRLARPSKKTDLPDPEEDPQAAPESLRHLESAKEAARKARLESRGTGSPGTPLQSTKYHAANLQLGPSEQARRHKTHRNPILEYKTLTYHPVPAHHHQASDAAAKHQMLNDLLRVSSAGSYTSPHKTQNQASSALDRTKELRPTRSVKEILEEANRNISKLSSRSKDKPEPSLETPSNTKSRVLQLLKYTEKDRAAKFSHQLKAKRNYTPATNNLLITREINTSK